MVDINRIMKQAKSMQDKMSQMQEERANLEFKGNSGGGMVEYTMKGNGEPVALKIDPSIVNQTDVEMLEDLIIASIKDAKKKSDESSEENMSGMLSGLGLPPGFKLPF